MQQLKIWEISVQCGTAQTDEKNKKFDTTLDDAEAKTDFWSVMGDFICRHQRGTYSQTVHAEKESPPHEFKSKLTWAICSVIKIRHSHQTPSQKKCYFCPTKQTLSCCHPSGSSPPTHTSIC